MTTKQVWAKGALITLLVALATLIPTGFVFADQANRTEAATVVADHFVCDLSWVTEASAIPGNVLDEICFAYDRPLSSDAAVATVANVPNELSWVTEASGVPSHVLDEIRFRFNRDMTPRAFTSPSVGFGQAYWEYTLELNYQIRP